MKAAGFALAGAVAIGALLSPALAQQTLSGIVTKIDRLSGTIAIRQVQDGTVGASGGNGAAGGDGEGGRGCIADLHSSAKIGQRGRAMSARAGRTRAQADSCAQGIASTPAGTGAQRVMSSTFMQLWAWKITYLAPQAVKTSRTPSQKLWPSRSSIATILVASAAWASTVKT